jgi:hypothetical protein
MGYKALIATRADPVPTMGSSAVMSMHLLRRKIVCYGNFRNKIVKNWYMRNCFCEPDRGRWNYGDR